MVGCWPSMPRALGLTLALLNWALLQEDHPYRFRFIRRYIVSLRSGQSGIGKTVTPKKKVFKTHALMYFSF